MPHINKTIAIPRNEVLDKNPMENYKKTFVTFHRILPDLRHKINKN